MATFRPEQRERFRASLEHGLVDRLGGLEEAVARAAHLAGLEAPRRLDLRPGPPVSRLSRMLRGLMRDAVPELRLIELWRRSCAVLCPWGQVDRGSFFRDRARRARPGAASACGAAFSVRRHPRIFRAAPPPCLPRAAASAIEFRFHLSADGHPLRLFCAPVPTVLDMQAPLARGQRVEGGFHRILVVAGRSEGHRPAITIAHLAATRQQQEAHLVLLYAGLWT